VTESVFDQVLLRVERPVAEIVLNRPEAHNALSTRMAEALVTATAAVAAHSAIRAVVLSARSTKASPDGASQSTRPSGWDWSTGGYRPARQAALDLAGQIARNSPVALRNAKRALRRGADVGLAAALDVEDAAWRATAFSGDRREGIAAFNERRSPDWPERS
jgi:enoyl-CoA hydratase/carnithine racemase